MQFSNLFSSVELESIEEMAAHGFTIAEIAEVVDKTDACAGNLTVVALSPRGKDSDGYKAYRRGFLRSQLELRQRIFKDAKHGSSPAQALAKKILDDAEYKLNNYE